VEHGRADPVGSGPVLITGSGGLLGCALADVFPEAIALTREELDVTRPFALDFRPSLVLHSAAWTDVEAAEADEEGADRVNRLGTCNVVALGAPIVYFSTDYVFDGRKEEPYVESDEPNPLSAYGRTKLAGEREVAAGWIVRTSWLFGPTSRNFVHAMLRAGTERGEVRVVDDQIGSPTYVGHLAPATKELIARPGGVWHLAAGGECTWAEFAEAIFEDARLACRVERISSDELGRSAPRPVNSVLRSQRPDAPTLPHWRDGLRECLAQIVGRSP
jgi:dTDP-4-dehydrorhamnose reductase